MEQAVAGGVGGTLEDPSNLLPSALKPSAPPAPPVDFDGEFLPRARFELIEVRHTLPPPSIPRARAIQPRRDRHPALARSDQHKKATRHRTAGTLFPPRTTRRAPVLFLLPRAPFPASDAPFPPHPPARPAGAHPRVGTGAGGDEGCSARLSDDARREPPRVPGRVSSRRCDARQPADAEAPARRDPVQRDLFVQTIHKDPAAWRGGSGSDRGSGGKSPQSPSPKPWSLPDRSRSRSHSGEAAEDGGAGSGPGVGATATATAGDPWAATAANRAYCSNRSTSFTSTPGPKTRRGEGESEDGSDAREREARDMLRSELEHDKAQNALLRESNARYEARVAQLEAAVRAAAEQTRELRDALETARADESRRRGVVVAEGRRSGSAFELAFDFERRRVDERETFEPRNVAGMGVEREAFAAMERRARGGDAGDGTRARRRRGLEDARGTG